MTRRLSVVIPTQNNETTLPAALASVAFADEIIVLDSGSVDRTRDIALGAGGGDPEIPPSTASGSAD